MSPLSSVVLALFGAWLGLLTLVVVLSLRQIGLLTMRAAVNPERFSTANDGPTIGSTVPALVASAIPDAESGPVQILFLSASCAPCRKVATDLSPHPLPSTVTALLAGREELADSLVELLPRGIRIVRDPDASNVSQALEIRSAPFAVAIDARKVTQKTYVHGAQDFISMVENSATVRGLLAAAK